MFERIMELCREKHITICRLEIMAGLSNGTVRRWDKSFPRMNSLIAVANALGVTPGYLLDGGKRGGRK